MLKASAFSPLMAIHSSWLAAWMDPGNRGNPGVAFPLAPDFETLARFDFSGGMIVLLPKNSYATYATTTTTTTTTTNNNNNKNNTTNNKTVR